MACIGRQRFPTETPLGDPVREAKLAKRRRPAFSVSRTIATRRLPCPVEATAGALHTHQSYQNPLTESDLAVTPAALRSNGAIEAGHPTLGRYADRFRRTNSPSRQIAIARGQMSQPPEPTPMTPFVLPPTPSAKFPDAVMSHRSRHIQGPTTRRLPSRPTQKLPLPSH